MDELMKKTETMLRAVLISSPRGVPLHRLDKEYRSITFEPIPYLKCSFRNLEDFLRKMPHVANIQRDRDGETVVMGVASEADKHVAKLIAKQKKPKIRKSSARPTRRPVSSFLSYRATPDTYTSSKFGPRSTYREPSFSPAWQPQVSTIPPTIRNQTPRFVPPRLRKILVQNAAQQSANGNRSSPGPNFGTMEITVSNRSASTPEERQAFSPNEKRKIFTRKGSHGTMEITVPNKPTAPSTAGKPTVQTTLSPDILEKIAETVKDKTNGYFLTRLRVEFKEKYQVELSSDVGEQLMSYPHILHMEKIQNFFIAYPPKAIKSPVVKENVEQFKEQRKPELYALKPFTIPAIGSPVQVYVSHIESLKEFYIQYKDSGEELNALLERLNADFKDPSDCVDNPTVGLYCCGQFSLDGSFYRGRVCEHYQENDTQKLKVFYVDFGNSEWLTRVHHLNEDHAELPQMAVRCSLYGLTSTDSSVTEKFKALIDQEMTMTFVERNGDTLSVQLTDEKGEDITKSIVESGRTEIQKSDSATITEEKTAVDETVVPRKEEREEASPQSPVEKNHVTDKKPVKPFLRSRSVPSEQEQQKTEKVVIPNEEFLDILVSTVISTENIFVTLYGEDYSDKLLALETSMMSYFLEFPEDHVDPAKQGEIWAIKSNELHSEDQWYRVHILSIDGSQALAEFVDYGDNRKVPLAKLVFLPARFLDLPFQAFQVSLNEIPKTKKPDVLDKLKHHVLGKPLVAEVIQRTPNKLSVELFDTSSAMDLNINEVMRSLIIPDEDLTPALPKVGRLVEARVSNITETGSVFVQIPGAGLKRLEELMTYITEHYSKSTRAAEFVSNPTERQMYCAKCADGNWYRVTITELLSERRVKVQCVDYGNWEDLPRTALREPTKANEHVNLLPFQAIECHLYGFVQDLWSAEKTEKMNELVSEDVILEIVKSDAVPQVKLFLTTEDERQVNVLEFILEEESSAKGDESIDQSASVQDQTDKGSSSQDDDQEDQSTDLPPPISLPRPWVDVTVSDIIDPGNLMFQPLMMIKSLDDMTNQMSDYYNNNKTDHLVSPRNGDLCAVRYGDGNYYRAVVKAVLSPQQVCVFFIDYGNVAIHPSSDFRVLSEQFKELPCVAVRGSLAGVQPCDNSGEWSDEAKRKFEELTSWKMLVACVEGDQFTYHFREEHKIPLTLYDTSSSEDINIADVLVSEGLARRTDT